MTITASTPALMSPLAVGTAMPFRVPPDPLGERDRLLSEGLVRVIVGDVLVSTTAPDSAEIRSAAANLLLRRLAQTTPAGWAVGFESAAWLLSGVPRDGRPAPETLQVIIPRGRRRPLSPWIRPRQIPLAMEEIVHVGEVPVTEPVRTAADLARDRPEECTLEILRRLGEFCGVRPHEVMSRLSTMPRARGVAQARKLVRAWELEP